MSTIRPRHILSMKENTIKGLFSPMAGGYITFPRAVVKHEFQAIGIYDPDSIYCHLLLNANYADGPDADGIYLKRGEINIYIARLAKITGWGRSALYNLLRSFEKEGLLASDKDHPHRYLLLMYEEHCGRSVRKEERPHTPAPEETQNRERFESFFEFYHFVMHTPQADKESAWKEWQKLSLEERDAAFQNLKTYQNSTKGNAHQKLACNYLKSKSFKL